VPLAQEFGLGITPWSPLKSGALSGKYRRDNQDVQHAGRGAWVPGMLDGHGYDVVDALVEIAAEAGSTPARVAVNWVCRQPGVTSTIIGARTLDQLDDNLAALDVNLTDAQLRRLTELTTPSLNFPAPFLKTSAGFRNSETTINGETASRNPLALDIGKTPY
jgi:aryl-alcohol dehydrogenase-like predicted oxidoreductase